MSHRKRAEIEQDAGRAATRETLDLVLEVLLDIRALLRAPYTSIITVKDGVTCVKMDEDL